MGRYLLLLLAGLLILSCQEEENQASSETELPSQIVDNFQMHESKSGNKLYYLEGEKALYYDKSDRIVVIEPHITFYDSKHNPTSETVCDSGVVSNRTGDLTAYGNVVVTTSDSTVLRTDSMVWFNRRARIETDARVRITSAQGTIQGKGLVSDADLNRIQIKQEVEGTTPYSVEEQ